MGNQLNHQLTQEVQGLMGVEQDANKRNPEVVNDINNRYNNLDNYNNGNNGEEITDNKITGVDEFEQANVNRKEKIHHLLLQSEVEEYELALNIGDSQTDASDLAKVNANIEKFLTA